MSKHFKYTYYLQKLYYDAGCTINDYLYAQHKNLVIYDHIEKLNDAISLNEKNEYCFHDNIGRAFSLLCHTVAENAIHHGNVFIFKDDSFITDKAMAVYLENGRKFIYSNENGRFMDEYYYRTDCTRQPVSHYIKLAEVHFKKSEYIAKQRCL